MEQYNRNRAMHSLVIARIMAALSGRYDMFCLGLIHEVGYRFTTDNPYEYGAELIRRSMLPFSEEVRNAGKVDSVYQSDELDLLNFASLLVNEEGKAARWSVLGQSASEEKRQLMIRLQQKGYQEPEHPEQFNALPYFANDRMIHDVMVGNVMYRLSHSDEMFLLGLLHDIGKYKANHEHAEVGGKLLKQMGYRYWREVYEHETEAGIAHDTEELDLLRVGDLSVDAAGVVAGYEARLKDLSTRYAPNHFLYRVLADNKGYLEAKHLLCPEDMIGETLR